MKKNNLMAGIAVVTLLAIFGLTSTYTVYAATQTTNSHKMTFSEAYIDVQEKNSEVSRINAKNAHAGIHSLLNALTDIQKKTAEGVTNQEETVAKSNVSVAKADTVNHTNSSKTDSKSKSGWSAFKADYVDVQTSSARAVSAN